MRQEQNKKRELHVSATCYTLHETHHRKCASSAYGPFHRMCLHTLLCNMGSETEMSSKVHKTVNCPSKEKKRAGEGRRQDSGGHVQWRKGRLDLSGCFGSPRQHPSSFVGGSAGLSNSVIRGPVVLHDILACAGNESRMASFWDAQCNLFMRL